MNKLVKLHTHKSS